MTLERITLHHPTASKNPPELHALITMEHATSIGLSMNCTYVFSEVLPDNGTFIGLTYVTACFVNRGHDTFPYARYLEMKVKETLSWVDRNGNKREGYLKDLNAL